MSPDHILITEVNLLSFFRIFAKYWPTFEAVLSQGEPRDAVSGVTTGPADPAMLGARGPMGAHNYGINFFLLYS